MMLAGQGATRATVPFVIPAQAGIQFLNGLDPRFRGGDDFISGW